MKKEHNSWMQIAGLLIAVSALAILAAAILLVVQNRNGPLAVTTPLPAPTQVVDESTPIPNYAETLSAIKTDIPESTAARPTGIFDADAGFYNQGYAMQNAWQSQVDGYWAYVVAGSRVDDPEQGVIFSRWEFPNAAIGNFYNTPIKAGPVRIIAEQNNRLTLQSDDGTVFYFDVPAQKFVLSLTEPAPTIIPPPTYTPMPPTQPAPTGYPLPTGGYPVSTAQATVAP